MLAIAALFAALLTVAASATANPSIQSKRAQAQAVVAEIQQKYSTLEKAIESYNLANDQLDQIDADLSSNAHHLVIARQSLSIWASSSDVGVPPPQCIWSNCRRSPSASATSAISCSRELR